MSVGWGSWQYLIWPLLAGIAVAWIAAPLGAVMVWRRLAYFGDTLSHSGLLGITLALAWQINTTLGVAIVAIAVAALLFRWQGRLLLASDTLLGILSHGSLAIGLIVLSWMPGVPVDLLGCLYGDILSVTQYEVIWIAVGASVVGILLLSIWSNLLRITLDADLAQVEGVSVQRTQALYLLLLACVVAFAIKIVGVLLITALLIIPPASARAFAKTPEQMVGWAVGFGTASVLGGMWMSDHWDLPAGPSIVAANVAMFVASHGLKKES